MNNIQLLIIAVTVITILAALLILWRKGVLQKHKKKIVSTLVSIIILSSGITLMFTGDVIVESGAIRGPWFKNSNYNTYYTTNTSIYLYDSYDAMIINNRIYGSPIGINLSLVTVDRARVGNNNILGCGTNFVHATLTGCNITGNIPTLT